jgi:hypothetical protein
MVMLNPDNGDSGCGWLFFGWVVLLAAAYLIDKLF